MTTLANEHISEHPPLTPTTQRKAAPWGYFLYCEVLKIFRDPAAVITTVSFPAIIFLIIGFKFSPSLSSTILASEAAYGAFLVSITTFSISLATERSLGWNKLLRTTSMSSALYLGSKLLVILVTGTIAMVLLFAVAGFSGIVHLDLAVWAELLGAMVLGIIPLSLLGLFLGFLGSPNLTVALSMTLLIVMSFASGIFIPMQYLPELFQKIAPYLPTYNLVQLGWTIVGSPSSDGQVWTHVLILLAYAAVFAVLAGWAYIRDENKNFA
jgi:ABC-2 type transport system permease protein